MQPSLCSEYSEEFLWRKTQNICVFTQPFPVRSRVLDMETNRKFGGLCNSSLQAELPTKVYTTRDLQSDWRKGKLGVAYYLEKSLPEESRKFTGRIPGRGRKGATGPLSSEAAEIGNSPRLHRGWPPPPAHNQKFLSMMWESLFALSAQMPLWRNTMKWDPGKC